MHLLQQRLGVERFIWAVIAAENSPGRGRQDAGVLHLHRCGDPFLPIIEENGIRDTRESCGQLHQIPDHTHCFFRRCTEGFESHRHKRRTNLGAAVKVLFVLPVMEETKSVMGGVGSSCDIRCARWGTDSDVQEQVLAIVLVPRQQQVRPLAIVLIGDSKHRECSLMPPMRST